jgi:hypothetical protein
MGTGEWVLRKNLSQSLVPSPYYLVPSKLDFSVISNELSRKKYRS